MSEDRDPLRALRGKRNLNRLRMVAQLPMALAKVRRESMADNPVTKANLDKTKGRAGFYRSSRAVHAFDSDANITVSRSWGDSSCAPGDFVIVGAPKASTNWHNDVYCMPKKEFLADFEPVTGVFHEYRRAGTFFAWSVVPETPHVNDGTAWSPEQQWYVHTSRNGESLRKDDEGQELTLKDTLFQEAFAPAFADSPFAHELINEAVRIVRTKEPKALLQTVGFRGANTLYVLNPGEVALVAGGQFKVGRMGSDDGGTKHSGQKDKDKIRRNSFMPTEMRLTTKAYMCGEIIGPFAASQELVTVTELASELFVFTTDMLQEFSDNALESMAALSAQQDTVAMNGLEENPAEKLDRVCRDFFKICDDDHSGSISPMEFSRVMRKQGKKFGPQFKDWFNRPLLIFEQIDEDGDGTIDEEEFVRYATERGDAMMLGLIMGATANTESSSANNVELAQREATDALVESLRGRLAQMEKAMANQLKSMKEEKTKLFNVVANACFGEMKD